MKNITLYITGLLSVTILLLAGSCAKTSLDEIPAYIKIDTISLNVTSVQGTASQKVCDAWIYADNDLIGGFSLPRQFPILKSGTTSLAIFAGVKLNGMNETRVPYPFYDKIVKSVNLEREKVLDLGHMKFKYADNTKFAWQENFEYSNYSVDSTSRSEVNMVRVKLPELETAFPNESNDYAGRVIFSNDSLVFECASHDSFKLPTDGTSVFMELNYKSNNPFTVGLFLNGAVTSQRAVLVVNPSSTWNKIYINFTPTLSSNSGVSSFKVFFTGRKNTSDTQGEIYIDNIKLLHF